METRLEQLYDYRRRLMERFSAIGTEYAKTVAALPAPAPHRSMDAPFRPVRKILAHTHDLEARLFWPSMQQILTSEEPFLDLPYEQAHAPHPDRQPIDTLLAEFLALRAQELSRLLALEDEDWRRTGRHLTWGMRSLQWWAELSLAHAEDHLEQLKIFSDSNHIWKGG